MRKSRFTETQILKVLKEVESGRQVKDVCREYGIADATYYNWKSKYGGMEVSDIKRLKELEEENSKLKRMYADMALENTALKDVIEKSSDAGSQARNRRLSSIRVRFECQAELQSTESKPLRLHLST
ncbi:Transposase [Idiomarina sp. A28L]|nr:Transposase [Idiomarina sp. A28L]